jgi:hypothetical protein
MLNFDSDYGDFAEVLFKQSLQIRQKYFSVHGEEAKEYKCIRRIRQEYFARIRRST